MPFALADEQLPLAESLQRLVVDIKHRRFALPERLSEGAQDLLNRLLHPEPQARIDMAGEACCKWRVGRHMRLFVHVHSWSACIWRV